MEQGKGPPIRFGIYEVDLQAGELRKRGVKLKLQQQPFLILAMLLERPGELVTREEIQKRLWPEDTFVDFDRGLNRATNRLRDSLGDDAGSPRYIETLPRRGYRFIAQIEKLKEIGHVTDRMPQQVETAPESLTSGSRGFVRVMSRPGLVIVMIGIASLVLLGGFFFLRPRDPAIESVAVMPFSNVSGDPDAEYLCDGITESLINNLSQFPTLRVMASSTVFRYKAREIALQKIGDDLHVQAVLSGTLLRQGNTLIVHAELVDVKTGTQIWAGQFNRHVEDVLAIQSDLSREISENLRLNLTGDERQRLARLSTEDAEAYQVYLKGRYYWNKRNPEAVQKAVRYFEQAISEDPAYALAYAGLADAYIYLSFFNVVSPRDAMPRAKSASLKALEMDGHSAEAHVSLGYISYSYDWDWAAAGKHFDRALALNPVYTRAHSFYPLYLISSGQPQGALAAAKGALALDPASPALSHYVALQLYFTRQFDQAIEQCHKTLEIDPTFAVAYQVLGEAYLGKGMNREAVPVFEKYRVLSHGGPDSIALLGYSHARLGERGMALAAIKELRAYSNKSFVPAFFIAVVYAGLEDKDQAFLWLEKGYDERYNRFAYLTLEAFWDPLRSDDRFSNLVRRIGIPP